MPAGREIIPNTPLSGAELREIILSDARKLVESHGLLASHIAYGRIGYEVIVRLHLQNASFADTSAAGQSANDTSLRSVPRTVREIDAHPPLAAIAPPPLSSATDDDSVVIAPTIARSIDSPNAERLRAGMPIPTLVRDSQTGSRRIELVHREVPPDIGPGDVMIDDATKEARAAWNLPPEPPTEEELAEQERSAAEHAARVAIRTEQSSPTPIDPTEEETRRRKLDEFYGDGTYDAIKAEEDAKDSGGIVGLVVPAAPAVPAAWPVTSGDE